MHISSALFLEMEVPELGPDLLDSRGDDVVPVI